jgi:hypothetical protein
VFLAVIIGYRIIKFEENAYKKQLAEMIDTIGSKDATIKLKEALLDLVKEENEKLRIDSNANQGAMRTNQPPLKSSAKLF